MTKKPQKDNTVLIVIAIIGIVGTIVTGIITATGNYNIEKLRQDTELTRIASVFIATQVSTTNNLPVPTSIPPVLLTTSTPTITIYEFEISSTKPWQLVTILEKGDLVTIKYKSGAWTNNKYFKDDKNSPLVDSIGYTSRQPFEDIVAGANLAALLGRVGIEYSFEIGKQKEFQSPISGNLELQINDDTLSDNDGSILVEIVIKR